MARYTNPDIITCSAREVGKRLGPAAELGYCLEDVTIHDLTEEMDVDFCVDPARWPNFDGIGSDWVEVNISKTGLHTSAMQPFSAAETADLLCFTFSINITSGGAGEYRVTIRLIIDGSLACEEERMVIVPNGD